MRKRYNNRVTEQQNRQCKTRQHAKAERPPEAAPEPEKKWAATLRLSTIDLIEQRFHEYYTAESTRLSKRELVEGILVRALKDDELVESLFGPAPEKSRPLLE